MRNKDAKNIEDEMRSRQNYCITNCFHLSI